MTKPGPKPPSRDEFEEWFATFDDVLDEFRAELKKAGLPSTVALENLEALEGYLLRKYETMSDIMTAADGPEYLNKFAIFIGEAIRTAYPPAKVKWMLVDDDPMDAFYGLPVVVLPDGYPVCPQSLVTATLDRRTGRYLSGAIKGSMT